jgi:predicted metal-dependent peptidase
MLIDTETNLPYYGEFNLHVNFIEQDNIGTCAINVNSKGMNFLYSPKFIQEMSQKEVNFIVLHEDFHLLFNHPKRTVAGQYDYKLSNIAQDMIINHIIWENISHNFVEIPKNKDGKNMALFVPKEYTGKLIFEELYDWLNEEKNKWQKQKNQNSKCQSCSCSCNRKDKKQESRKVQDQIKNQEEQYTQKQLNEQVQFEQQSEQRIQDNIQSDNKQVNKSKCCSCRQNNCNKNYKDSIDKLSYGPYGKNPFKPGETIDTWSKEHIFQTMENNNGEYMDKHINDEVNEDIREAMVKDIIERLSARGLSSNNIEIVLNKLRKKRKDYLREIKKSVSNMILGTVKQKTIVKPNRRQISGLKGNRKVKAKINVILDTSGSMYGTFDKVLSYIYRNDIEVNLIEADTDVKLIQKIKNKRNLETLPIKGLGGTILQPAIDLIVDRFNEYNTVLLTDGYCDSLDFSKIKGSVLIISISNKVPIYKTNRRIKQIVVKDNE